MPFKDDSPFEKWTGKSNIDLENGKEARSPLLEPQDEAHTEGQEVDNGRVEGEGEDHLQHPLVKHVHFSESLQRALEEKEWVEEQGLEEDEDDTLLGGTWKDFWEWVKAETKCYANYICPVVLVNACILLIIIVYFCSKKN